MNIINISASKPSFRLYYSQMEEKIRIGNLNSRNPTLISYVA